MSKFKKFMKKMLKKDKNPLDEYEESLEEESEDILDDSHEDESGEFDEEIEDIIDDETVEEEEETLTASEASKESTQIVDLNSFSEGLDDYDIGEETVIMDGIELSEELIPHESNETGQLPSKSDLEFPNKSEEKQNENVIQKVMDHIDDPEIPSEEDLEYPDIPPTPSAEETEDQNEEIDEILEDVEEEEDIEQLLDTEEEQGDIDEPYEEDQTGVTGTETFDLTNTTTTLKDKVDHFKLRVVDKFRNINKKDLNQVYKKEKEDIKPKLNFGGLKSSASNINWSNLPNTFFGHSFRPSFHKFYQRAFVLTLVFSITKIVASLVSGSPDYKSLTKKNYINFDDGNKLTQGQVVRVEQANIFQTNQVTVKQTIAKKPKVNVNKICSEATKKSKSSAKLLSTIVLQDSVKSIASVQVRGGKKGMEYKREGDTLPGNLKLDKILGYKLIVKNLSTGECEYIENTSQKKKFSRVAKPKVLSPKKSREFKKKNKKIAGIETDGNTFKIEKKFLQSKLKDINSLLTQARGIPIRNPDGSLAFKIVEIEPGGVFDYLGITDGDIISEINGEPIKEMNEVMNLFGKISNIPNLNLTIKRNGENVTQSYNIK